MDNIFISFSNKDVSSVDAIISGWEMISHCSNLFYFKRKNGRYDTTMKEVIDKLRMTDTFIIFISNNSLNSAYVRKEMKEAIKLAEKGIIDTIQPIILDDNIRISIDRRIPHYIKNICKCQKRDIFYCCTDDSKKNLYSVGGAV